MIVVKFVHGWTQVASEVDTSPPYFFPGRGFVEVILQVNLQEDLLNAEAIPLGRIIEGQNMLGHGFEIDFHFRVEAQFPIRTKF